VVVTEKSTLKAGCGQYDPHTPHPEIKKKKKLLHRDTEWDYRYILTEPSRTLTIKQISYQTQSNNK
jgi:hypothetical protein